MKYLKHIVSVFIFILLISNIYLYNNYRKAVNSISSLTKKIGEMEKEIEKLQIINNDKNWQTYKNEGFNYEFKHPNLKFEDVSTLGMCKQSTANCLNFMITAIPSQENTKINFWISTENFPKNNKITDRIQKIKESVSVVDVKEKIIDNINVYVIDTQEDVRVITALMHRNDYLYEITIQNPNDESLIIYDKILESFKFTN